MSLKATDIFLMYFLWAGFDHRLGRAWVLDDSHQHDWNEKTTGICRA